VLLTFARALRAKGRGVRAATLVGELRRTSLRNHVGQSVDVGLVTKLQLATTIGRDTFSELIDGGPALTTSATAA
jgi:hypothetical protein